nr:MAG TPA: hypothetical protein [Caudoviricetes sp.]
MHLIKQKNRIAARRDLWYNLDHRMEVKKC